MPEDNLGMGFVIRWQPLKYPFNGVEIFRPNESKSVTSTRSLAFAVVKENSALSDVM